MSFFTELEIKISTKICVGPQNALKTLAELGTIGRPPVFWRKCALRPTLGAGSKRNKTGRIKEPHLKPSPQSCSTGVTQMRTSATELKTNGSTHGQSPELCATDERLLNGTSNTGQPCVGYDSRLLSSTTYKN